MNMNEVVCEYNLYQKDVEKRWPVRTFSKMSAGHVLCLFYWQLTTYGNKGYSICLITHRNNLRKAAGQIEIGVCGKTYLLFFSW